MLIAAPHLTRGRLVSVAETDREDQDLLAESRRRTALGVGLKTIYGSGNMVDGISVAVLSSFLLFYVTAVCGLSGTLAGAALFIALGIDAFADPALGSLSDNSWSRWGRRHPFMLGSAIPIAVAFGLMFSIPPQLKGLALFGYVTVVSIAVRVSLSTFIVPYTALGAELSDDYAERSSIVAYRVLFSVFATFLVVFLGFSVFLHGDNGLLRRASYAPFGWTCGGLMLLAVVLSTVGTRGVLDRLHRVPVNSEPPLARFFREIAEIFRNRSFRTLFLGAVIFFVAQGVAASLSLHANKFFWKLPVGIIQLISGSAAVGLLLGLPISGIASRLFEKKTVVLAGIGGICVSQAFPPLIEIAGILPNTGPVLYGVLIGNTIVAYAFVTCVVVAFQSMMADAADEHEHLFGARREGLYFAGLSFGAKAASGLGGFIAGGALDMIGFPSAIAAQQGDHLHVASGTLRALGLVYGPGAALLTAVGVWVLGGYRLNRAEHARIQAELSERRRAAVNL